MKRTVKIENVGIVDPLFASGVNLVGERTEKRACCLLCWRGGGCLEAPMPFCFFFIHAPLSQLPVG